MLSLLNMLGTRSDAEPFREPVDLVDFPVGTSKYFFSSKNTLSMSCVTETTAQEEKRTGRSRSLQSEKDTVELKELSNMIKVSTRKCLLTDL